MVIGEHHRGRHQGAQKGPRGLRAGEVRGPESGLIDQERPNTFTNSVVNIGPRETVVVQIEYQGPVCRSGNEFSLRVPLVVAPRYCRSRSCRRSTSPPADRDGDRLPIPCPIATASRRWCSIRASNRR
jgi:hypothetical protein